MYEQVQFRDQCGTSLGEEERRRRRRMIEGCVGINGCAACNGRNGALRRTKYGKGVIMGSRYLTQVVFWMYFLSTSPFFFVILV